MPSKEYYFEQIEKEFAAAREALQSGNDGKARVCSRRAAGHAIRWFLERHSEKKWGADAMNQLSHLRDDASFPVNVRDAATRLTTKISDRFTYPFTTNPIDDAQCIITHISTLME